MPCYKGEKFIQDSIRITECTISQFESNFEIIVVIDGFVNNAFEKVRMLSGEFSNLKVIGYEVNRGKGYAIQHGLANSLVHVSHARVRPFYHQTRDHLLASKLSFLA